jgi:hypothetical protein
MGMENQFTSGIPKPVFKKQKVRKIEEQPKVPPENQPAVQLDLDFNQKEVKNPKPHWWNKLK